MERKGAEAIDIRYLLSSLLFWMMCSAIMLPFAALGAHIFKCGETALAYISSSLSFVSALLAGAKAMHTRKRNAIGTAFVTGVCIIILALTLGFIVAGEKLDAAGILSVVTFTISGSLVGAVFFPGQKKQSRRKGLNISKKK